jgi:dsDNA-specific endonuclease/ATPase MutS2
LVTLEYLLGNIGKNPSGLEALQKQHEEKTRKVEELKSQIVSVTLDLEKKRKDALEDKKEVFKSLSDKYNSLREEYNTLAERSSE